MDKDTPSGDWWSSFQEFKRTLRGEERKVEITNKDACEMAYRLDVEHKTRELKWAVERAFAAYHAWCESVDNAPRPSDHHQAYRELAEALKSARSCLDNLSERQQLILISGLIPLREDVFEDDNSDVDRGQDVETRTKVLYGRPPLSLSEFDAIKWYIDHLAKEAENWSGWLEDEESRGRPTNAAMKFLVIRLSKIVDRFAEGRRELVCEYSAEKGRDASYEVGLEEAYRTFKAGWINEAMGAGGIPSPGEKQIRAYLSKETETQREAELAMHSSFWGVNMRAVLRTEK